LSKQEKEIAPKSNINRKRSFREGYIGITDDITKQIENHIERTGLSIHSFMNLYGLNYIGIQSVEHWVKKRAKSAQKEHLEALLNTWKTVPDNYYIKIIPEMSEYVKSEIKRTGFGRYKILRGNKKAKENDITAAEINLVINCCSSKVKATMLHQILALWKDKPDKK
jgi:hypothetical protein